MSLSHPPDTYADAALAVRMGRIGRTQFHHLAHQARQRFRRRAHTCTGELLAQAAAADPHVQHALRSALAAAINLHQHRDERVGSSFIHTGLYDWVPTAELVLHLARLMLLDAYFHLKVAAPVALGNIWTYRNLLPWQPQRGQSTPDIHLSGRVYMPVHHALHIGQIAGWLPAHWPALAPPDFYRAGVLQRDYDSRRYLFTALLIQLDTRSQQAHSWVVQPPALEAALRRDLLGFIHTGALPQRAQRLDE